jgi:small subunit ribosomal protein S21|tara:strand:+ start:661 stop:891 length:231 start_codon:yes stop_codon:yes gene_type:complete
VRKRRKEKSRGLYVDVRNNNIEGALKKFKRKVKDSGLMVELRDRQYYEKPSEKRRREKNLSKSRQRYKVIKEKKHY